MVSILELNNGSGYLNNDDEISYTWFKKNIKNVQDFITNFETLEQCNSISCTSATSIIFTIEEKDLLDFINSNLKNFFVIDKNVNQTNFETLFEILNNKIRPSDDLYNKKNKIYLCYIKSLNKNQYTVYYADFSFYTEQKLLIFKSNKCDIIFKNYTFYTYDK